MNDSCGMQSHQSLQNLHNDNLDRQESQPFQRRWAPETSNIGAQYWLNQAKMLAMWSLGLKVIKEIRESVGAFRSFDSLQKFQFE